jgi:hypothetical protein
MMQNNSICQYSFALMQIVALNSSSSIVQYHAPSTVCLFHIILLRPHAMYVLAVFTVNIHVR